MSFELTQKILRNRLPVTSNEKMLLAMIADRIDHKGYCYPSVSRLAYEASLSKRHVVRSLKALCKINVLVINRIAGANSEYSILEDVLSVVILKCAKENPVSVVTHSHPPKSDMKKHESLEGDHEGTQEKTKGSQEKTKKPKKQKTEPKKGKLGGDTQSGVGVTGGQGGSDTQSGEGCHPVTLIDKTINKPIDNLNKAKPSPIAKPLMIDGVELVEGESVIIDIEGKGKTAMEVATQYQSDMTGLFKHAMSHATFTDFPEHQEAIPTFGKVTNKETADFIYHCMYGLTTLKEGEAYNCVTYGVPTEMIDRVEVYLKSKGLLTTFLTQGQGQAQYLKMYRPKALIPKKAPNFEQGGIVTGYDFGKNEQTVIAVLSHGESNMPTVEQIEAMVTTGKNTLKPAKATPIRTWRDAVLEWRSENDVTGDPLDFGQKHAGILNKAKKKFGTGFEIAMVHAVLRWKAFVTYANMNTGKNSKPAQPDILYFVLNIENVKLFQNQKSDTKVKLNKKPTKLKVTKKVLKDGKQTKTQQLLAAVKAKEKKT